MISNSEALLEQDKLLSSFFEAVKKCQVRFGGKTELATEGDPCVTTLCQSLEEILCHGLRTQSHNKGIKAIRHVKDFVSSGLHLAQSETDKPVLWWFIRDFLTKHEYQRFMLLRNLNTDLGRGKAWLRSLLNEHSLERYIHIMLSEKEVLESWYESFALLRDQEKAAMLPNLAAGLDSILFAINIDNQVLDGTMKTNLKSESTIPERNIAPILAKELPVAPTKIDHKRRKRKIPSQLVSFDEDDLNSSSTVLPTGYHSAPTTCVNSPAAFSAKTTPYSDSIENSVKNLPNQMESDLKVCKSESTEEKHYGLSTMSGNHLDLMPVSPDGDVDYTAADTGSIRSSQESSVDSTEEDPPKNDCTQFSSLTMEELRSAVLEISKARDCIEEQKRDLTVALTNEREISSNLRAQLTHESANHNETTDKLTVKINSLTRENELLRHQLKKYVGAVQMLKRDSTEGIGNLDSSINAVHKPPDLRDYHDEAMAYESKLIQVAEMHGELIEFNERLQKLLRHRELQLENLRDELIELRGPLPEEEVDADSISITSDVANSPRTLINVWIPTAFLSGSSSDTYHVYQIYVRIRDDEWNVYRRFAQFYELHRNFKKKYPVARTFDFPQKKTFGNKDISVVEDRRVRLQQYLRQIVNVLISVHPQLSIDPDKQSLVGALPFLTDSQSRSQPNRGGSRTLFSRLSNQEPARSTPQYNGL